MNGKREEYTVLWDLCALRLIVLELSHTLITDKRRGDKG
jgi:hypothetical protein